jgi:hypothetical protein
MSGHLILLTAILLIPTERSEVLYGTEKAKNLHNQQFSERMTGDQK